MTLRQTENLFKSKIKILIEMSRRVTKTINYGVVKRKTGSRLKHVLLPQNE